MLVMVSDRRSEEKLYRESVSTVTVTVVSGVNLLVNSQVIFLGSTVGLSRVTVKERVIVIPVMVVAKFPPRAVTTGTAERQIGLFMRHLKRLTCAILTSECFPLTLLSMQELLAPMVVTLTQHIQ